MRYVKWTAHSKPKLTVRASLLKDPCFLVRFVIEMKERIDAGMRAFSLVIHVGLGRAFRKTREHGEGRKHTVESNVAFELGFMFVLELAAERAIREEGLQTKGELD